MWLRHFLSKDLPGCRVLIYGYNAKLSGRGTANIEDYCREFLEEIKRVRGNEETRKRPLIFVAHSFGGIILARSLIKAIQSNDSDHQTIASLHKATYALLLFAVPHSGLDVEDMRKIMGSEEHPRTGLLQQIDIDSSQLKQQLADFKDILYDRKVVSFYETEQSRRLQRNERGDWARTGDYFTSLESERAVLQLPKQIETLIPLHSDHSGIVKFDNRNESGYRHTIEYLQSFEQDALAVVQARFCK